MCKVLFSVPYHMSAHSKPPWYILFHVTCVKKHFCYVVFFIDSYVLPRQLGLRSSGQGPSIFRSQQAVTEWALSLFLNAVRHQCCLVIQLSTLSLLQHSLQLEACLYNLLHISTILFSSRQINIPFFPSFLQFFPYTLTLFWNALNYQKSNRLKPQFKSFLHHKGLNDKPSSTKCSLPFTPLTLNSLSRSLTFCINICKNI